MGREGNEGRRAVCRFADKLRRLAEDAKKRFPDLPYDVEADILKYKDIAARVLPFVGDSVDYINTAWEQGALLSPTSSPNLLCALPFPFLSVVEENVGMWDVKERQRCITHGHVRFVCWEGLQ